jgi:hypothetical protein
MAPIAAQTGVGRQVSQDGQELPTSGWGSELN